MKKDVGAESQAITQQNTIEGNEYVIRILDLHKY